MSFYTIGTALVQHDTFDAAGTATLQIARMGRQAMERFPKCGTPWEELKRRLIDMRQRDVDWRRGRAALLVYYAGEDVLSVAREAYTMFISGNALAPAAFPSLATMERDLIEAALDLFHAPSEATGSFTSGGSESILLAVKTARDWHAQRRRKLNGPAEIVMSRTAHPAFDKAAQLLGVKAVRVPAGTDYRADPDALAGALTERTIMLVVSAPTLPYGLIDPVTEIAKIARDNDVWLHVDACIGGFLAPFAKRLGFDIPDFDFAIPGVRSISADLHKYGYAAKGASIILYSHRDFYKHQVADFSNWPKGRYFTPTLAGTRAGGALAAAWAVVHYLGESGYLARTSRVMQTWRKYLAGIEAIPELFVIGSPHLAILSYASQAVDIFSVADELARKGWYMSRLTEPQAIHQMVNIAHESSVEEYLWDLTDAIRQVRNLPARREMREVSTY
jgi:sphinganine-1-phosphate aldolase